MEEISNLHHADVAMQLDELSAAARAAEVPNGMGAANDLPEATPPTGVASYAGSGEAAYTPEQLSAMVDAMDFEDLRAAVPEGLDTSGISSAWQSQINDMLAAADRLKNGTDADQQRARSLLNAADKLQAAVDDLNAGFDPLADLTLKLDVVESVRQTSKSVYLEMGFADEAAILRAAIDQYTELMNQVQAGTRLDDLATRSGMLDDLAAAMAVDLGEGFEGLGSTAPWPRALVEGDAAGTIRLAAEVDALKSLKDAVDAGEDPVTAALRLMEEAKEAYGLASPRTQAFVDLAAWTTAQYAGLLDELGSPTAVSGLGELTSAMDLAEAEEAHRALLDDILAALANQVVDTTGVELDPAQLEGLGASGPWSRALAEGGDADNLRLVAALDAARSLKEATDSGEDPIAAVLRLMAESKDAYGLNDPRTQAYVDLAAWATAEYAGLLDELTAGSASASALDDLRAPVVQPSPPDVPGGLDAGAAPSLPPGRPGLVDEVVSGDELHHLTNPPAQASPFGSAGTSGVRQILDVDVETVEAGAGTRLGGIGSLTDVETGSPVQPRLNDAGAGWQGAGDVLRNVDTNGLPAPGGDYQLVNAAAGDTVGNVQVSTDTRAVVDGMPTQALPDDFDWRRTMDQFDAEYMEYRRGSNWRGALAYEDAVGEMKADLLRGIAELGGDPEAVRGENTRTMYLALQDLLARATQSDDGAQVQRITEFMEAHDARFYNMVADLGQRGDEFATTRALDAHIDQDKLLAWLQTEQEDAMRRVGAATTEAEMTAASHEATYYQQMVLAVSDGRSPTVESGDQIAYLYATGKTAQADLYMQYQQRLADVMSNAEFHNSAQVMGDDTYAKVHFLRPELGSPPPATANVQTQVFEPEVREPTHLGGGGETISGNYAANHEVISDQVGANDFARVPDERPRGLESPPQAEPEGPRGILTNTGGNRPTNFDQRLLVNAGPGEELTDQSTLAWSRAMRDEADEIAKRIQGGYGNYMDQTSELMPEWLRHELELTSRNPYAATRLDAANQLWDAQRTRDARPPPEWERWPSRNGMRSWDSGAHGRRSVRFGDAEVLTVAVEADDLVINSKQIVTRKTSSDMPWWTGSGINRAADPLNTNEAVRHVPTPRLPTDRPSYPSSWRASRQPGFGRLGDAPGTFPFNARERMITALMQGERLDASHIDVLQGSLDAAVRANHVQHREWLKMTALIRNLRYGSILGDVQPYARTLDWKTLEIMLNMANAGAAVV